MHKNNTFFIFLFPHSSTAIRGIHSQNIHSSHQISIITIVERSDLRTLLIIANADAALVGKTRRPPSTDIEVGLGDLSVGAEENGSKDGLGEDVEDGVGDDLGADADLASSVGNAPNTTRY